MTLSTTLFGLAAALLSYIGLYWAVLFLLVLTGLLHRFGVSVEVTPEVASQAVTILIPVHYEGVAVVDTVSTVLQQDHPGQVSALVLVCDFDDSSVPHLEAAYPTLQRHQEADGLEALRFERGQRRLTILAAGVSAKHAKLNLALARCDTPFIGVLDADHRATPSWISTALPRFARQDVAAVQSRKAPLSTNKIVQVWDSALSHLGHEMLNRGLEASGLDVFFTGSTALFRREALVEHGFTDTLTEDTYLSFDILLGGGRIAYEPRIGSYEEMSPNLASFAGRRRRWSAGHTDGFVRHLRKLLTSRASWLRKAHCLLIGQFFLLPALVTLFFACQGLFYFLQLTPQVQGLTLLLAAVGASLLLVLVSRTSSSKLNDALVAFLWILPHVAMAGALFYLLFDHELFYFILEFPSQPTFWAVQLLYIGGAVALLIGAAIVLRVLRGVELLTYLLTLPLVLFLEVFTALLGLSDYLFGRRWWAKIDRANVVSATNVPEELRRTLKTGRQQRARRLLWLPAVAIATLFTVNELASVDPCGHIEPLLWPPLFSSAEDEVRIDLRVDKALLPSEASRPEMMLSLGVQISAPAAADLRLRVLLDRQRLLDAPVQRGRQLRAEQRLPLGWGSRRLTLAVSGGGVRCVQRRRIAENHVALVGRELRVNGEPFIVKGMVPSFSSARTNVKLTRGLAQMKAIGSNLARFYHPPGRALLDASRATQLLLMVQPQGSTWENIDPLLASDQQTFLRRFDQLAKVTQGQPFVLVDNIGNELEINDRSPEMLRAISALARRIGARYRRPLIGYSTFATYVDFPVAVLGINMLDSGRTYWDKALQMVRSFERPYLASELGGFVAFFGKPPAELRMVRLADQWRELLARDAIGGVLFSTHDNWAQPVPPGSTNDPFRPEQPDDRRGFWDDQNRPKPELAVAAELFADVEVRAIPPRIEPGAQRVEVALRNSRPYALRQIVLTAKNARLSLGDLRAFETRRVLMPLAPLRALRGYPRAHLRFQYTSHAGLSGRCRAQLVVPEVGRRALVLNRHFWPDASAGDGRLRGRVFAGRHLEVLLPRGCVAVSIQGRRFPCSGERIRLPIVTPYLPVSGLELASRGAWLPLGAQRLGIGRRTLRFRLPTATTRQRLLLLAGLGAWRMVLASQGRRYRLPAHPYRETILDLDRLKLSPGAQLTLTINRRNVEYLSVRRSRRRASLQIDFERPRVFAPYEVEIVHSR
ncbi:MAG: hypothetical protein CSA65_09305 [Proteobacteria bacterium]|nr:MAG: hypothetical protein CSA65_09305 [Pseudomonadota bacterium]